MAVSYASPAIAAGSPIENKATEIPARVAALENDIDALGSTVDALIARLAPALRPQEIPAADNQKVGTATLTQLGDQLATQCSRLYAIKSVLADALHRLEL